MSTWKGRISVAVSTVVLMHTSLVNSSVDDDEERLPFLDDVGGELRRVPVADVPHRVNRLGRHHQRFTGVVRLRRLPVDLILERAFEDVDDLLARMLVPDRRRFRAELDAVLDHMASWDGEIVLLQIRTPQSRRLLHWCAHIYPRVVSGPTKAARWGPLPTDATPTPSLRQLWHWLRSAACKRARLRAASL